MCGINWCTVYSSTRHYLCLWCNCNGVWELCSLSSIEDNPKCLLQQFHYTKCIINDLQSFIGIIVAGNGPVSHPPRPYRSIFTCMHSTITSLKPSKYISAPGSWCYIHCCVAPVLNVSHNCSQNSHPIQPLLVRFAGFNLMNEIGIIPHGKSSYFEKWFID